MPGASGTFPFIVSTPDDWIPTLEDTLFDRIGGREGCTRLSEAFYDAMSEHEEALARLHEVDDNGRVTDPIRQHFALFLTFWLGGPRDYLEVRGHPALRMRHAPFAIDIAMRDAWLNSMGRALDALGIEGAVRAHLDGRFGQVADFLRNVEEPSATGSGQGGLVRLRLGSEGG